MFTQPQMDFAAVFFAKNDVFWLAFFLRYGIIQNIVFSFINAEESSQCLEGWQSAGIGFNKSRSE